MVNANSGGADFKRKKKEQRRKLTADRSQCTESFEIRLDPS